MGLFDKLKAGLQKTHAKLAHEIKRIVTGSPKLTDATIEDLESKNHTFVGPVRVTQPHPLQPGDILRLGGPTMIFRRATVKTVTVKTKR